MMRSTSAGPAWESILRNQGVRPRKRDQRTFSGDAGLRNIFSNMSGVSPANTGVSLVLTTMPALPNDAPEPGASGSTMETRAPVRWMWSAAQTPAMPEPTTRQSGAAVAMIT